MDQSLPVDRTTAPVQAATRAALICNPRAGTLSRMSDPVPALRSAIEAAGFAIVGEARHDDGFENQWRYALDADAKLVFVAGGDGTLRAVAAMAMRDDVALALLPGGTMNRVCTRLGLTNDPVGSIIRYALAPEGRLDVGIANGEVFLFESLLGAPARLLRFREMQRGGGLLGWLPLAKMAWRKLHAFELGRVRLSLANGVRLRGSAAVITLPEPGQAHSLTVGVTRHGGAWQRLGQALAWFRGRLRDRPDAQMHQTHRLVMFSHRKLVRLSLDGEMQLLPPPVRYRIAPGALRILVPRA